MAALTADLKATKRAIKDGKVARRNMGFWCEFNSWYRTFWEAEGRRPSVIEVKRWYDESADACWGELKPTWDETRTHSKCLRSLDQVRSYFRQYRAAKKECTEAGSKLDLASQACSVAGALRQSADVLVSGRKLDDVLGVDAAYLRAAKVRRASDDTALNGLHLGLIGTDLTASNDTSPASTYCGWSQDLWPSGSSIHATMTNGTAPNAATVPAARVTTGGQPGCHSVPIRTVSTGGMDCGHVATGKSTARLPPGGLADTAGRPASTLLDRSSSDQAAPLGHNGEQRPFWPLPLSSQQPRQHAAPSMSLHHGQAYLRHQSQQHQHLLSPPSADQSPQPPAAQPYNREHKHVPAGGGSRGATCGHQGTADLVDRPPLQLTGHGKAVVQPLACSALNTEPAVAPTAVATACDSVAALTSAISGSLDRQRSGPLAEPSAAGCVQQKQQQAASSVHDQPQVQLAHLTRSSSYHPLPPASHHLPLLHMGYGHDPTLYGHPTYMDPYFSYGMSDPYWGMYSYCYPPQHHPAHAPYLDPMPHPEEYVEPSFGIVSGTMGSQQGQATGSGPQQLVGAAVGSATLTTSQPHGAPVAPHQGLGRYNLTQRSNAAAGQACQTVPAYAAASQPRHSHLNQPGALPPKATECSSAGSCKPQDNPAAPAVGLLRAGSGPLVAAHAAQAAAPLSKQFEPNNAATTRLPGLAGAVRAPGLAGQVAATGSREPPHAVAPGDGAPPPFAPAVKVETSAGDVALAFGLGELASLAPGSACDVTAILRVRAPSHGIKPDPGADDSTVIGPLKQLGPAPACGSGDGGNAVHSSLESSLPKVSVDTARQKQQQQQPHADLLAETPLSLKGFSVSMLTAPGSTPAGQSLQLGMEMLPIPDLAALDPELDLAMFLFSPPTFAGVEQGCGFGSGMPL